MRGWFKQGDLVDIELADARRNMQHGIQRQVMWPDGSIRIVGSGAQKPGTMFTMPANVDMSPTAVRMRKQRQNEMMQRVAQLKRGNKPSYRQRQRNARAAKK